MEPSELVLLTVVVALSIVAVTRGGFGLLQESWRETYNLVSGSWWRLLIGFTMAGLITVVVPTELISRYMGEGSGWVGYVIGTVAGGLTPGGPFVQFPLVAALYRGGAAPGPLTTYLTAWSILGLQRILVWEIPFLGPQFVIARVAVCALIPAGAGLAVAMVMRALDR